MRLLYAITLLISVSLGFYTGYQTGRESAAAEQFGVSPPHVFSVMPGLTIEVPEQKAEQE